MLGFSDMPVAWVAHLGGFFAGLVLFPLFDRPFRAPPMSGELAAGAAADGGLIARLCVARGQIRRSAA